MECEEGILDGNAVPDSGTDSRTNNPDSRTNNLTHNDDPDSRTNNLTDFTNSCSAVGCPECPCPNFSAHACSRLRSRALR
jgi:hypothetical protein